jgi:tetratricopeptide (TPR) repeat protein
MGYTSLSTSPYREVCQKYGAGLPAAAATDPFSQLAEACLVQVGDRDLWASQANRRLSPKTPSTKQRPMLRSDSTAPAILAVAVLLAYFNALGGVFQFDDYNVIVNNPAIANNLGYAYQQAGRYAEAKLAYRQAIELDPDYWKARINLDALESARSR